MTTETPKDLQKLKREINKLKKLNSQLNLKLDEARLTTNNFISYTLNDKVNLTTNDVVAMLENVRNRLF